MGLSELRAQLLLFLTVKLWTKIIGFASISGFSRRDFRTLTNFDTRIRAAEQLQTVSALLTFEGTERPKESINGEVVYISCVVPARPQTAPQKKMP